VLSNSVLFRILSLDGGNFDLAYQTGSEVIQLGTMTNPEKDKILQFARPSMFGKNDLTVYDENIRRGKEITAQNLLIKLSITEEHDNKEQTACDFEILDRPYTINDFIHEYIFRVLPANYLGRNAQAHFYKLAIYEADGHFEFHRDSTHSVNHHATLLIEVKSDHKGGKLVFENSENLPKQVCGDWSIDSTCSGKDNIN
jgi:hypothetical protein